MLRERIVRAWDRALHTAIDLSYRNPRANPERYDIELIRDVPYQETGRRAHLLDVYRPKRARNSPAVLYVHGGGFALLSKDTHRVMALAFAMAGYTVFIINYRIGPRHRYPAQLTDAAQALLWVADHASSYGADDSRIVIAGESAGGNLVTALAYVATHERPEAFARAVYDRQLPLAAVLPIYGLLDLNDMDRFDRMPWVVRRAIRNAGRAYVGGPLAERAPLAPLASPLALLEQSPPEGARPLPPFFIACGTADPLLGDSKRLHEALRARGTESELSIHPNEIHGFNAMYWRPEAQAKWRAAFEFLSRHVDPKGAAA